MPVFTSAQVLPPSVLFHTPGSVLVLVPAYRVAGLARSVVMAWTLCGAPGTMFFAAGSGIAEPSCSSPTVAPSHLWDWTQSLPRTLSKL